MLFYSYPTANEKLLIPEVLLHGTTNIGVQWIRKFGIQSRGFTSWGKQKSPSSLDFGEGFYTSYNNKICRQQVEALAHTRASGYPAAVPRVIHIHVHPDIHQDGALKCLYFDGRKHLDGLQWADFVVHHRVLKDSVNCVATPCNGHPDIMMGPVADGNAISIYANDVFNGEMDLEKFYDIITQARWFPDYRQVVFGPRAIKYLRPVL